MSTLPTRAVAHAYITEHGLQDILNRAVNACVHAKAADPIGFIIEHLKAVKEAATSNIMVAEEKEEATTAVVPAVTSEFDEELLTAAIQMFNWYRFFGRVNVTRTRCNYCRGVSTVSDSSGRDARPRLSTPHGCI